MKAMKAILLLLSAFILNGYLNESMSQEKSKAVNNDVLTVHYTSGVEDLVHIWSAAYKTTQTANINTIPVKDHNLHLKADELCILSDADLQAHQINDTWKMVIGRSIVVPVIHKENKYLKELLQKGTTLSQLNAYVLHSSGKNTHNVSGTKESLNLPVFIENDAMVKNIILSNHDDLPLKNQMMVNKTDLLSTFNEDKNAILFCQLSHILNANGELISSTMQLLPIDKNYNGKMDPVEQIYTNLNTFYRGVWLGKYPSSLYQNLYLTAAAIPQEGADAGFAKWVITKGQAYLEAQGFRQLVSNEIPSKLASIQIPDPIPELTSTTPFFNRYIIYIGLLLMAVLVIIELRIRKVKKHKHGLSEDTIEDTPAFNTIGMETPGGLKFDTSHTWAFMEKDGNVRIGLDDFLMHATGKNTRVVLKSEGGRIKKGEHLLTLIQEGKQLNIKAPVSGTITFLNDNIIYDPSLVHSSPYDKGWVYVISPENWESETHVLFNSIKYKEWIYGEIKRFKAFIVSMLQGKDNEMQAVVLQDGGELVDNTLKHLDPDVWEEFQNQFLD